MPFVRRFYSNQSDLPPLGVWRHSGCRTHCPGCCRTDYSRLFVRLDLVVCSCSSFCSSFPGCSGCSDCSTFVSVHLSLGGGKWDGWRSKHCTSKLLVDNLVSYVPLPRSCSTSVFYTFPRIFPSRSILWKSDILSSDDRGYRTHSLFLSAMKVEALAGSRPPAG